MKKFFLYSLIVQLIIIVLWLSFFYLFKRDDIKELTVKVEKEFNLKDSEKAILDNNNYINISKLSWVIVWKNSIITANHWVWSIWEEINIIIWEKIINWKVIKKDSEKDLAMIETKENIWKKILYSKNYKVWDKVKTYSFYFWKKQWTIVKIEWDKIYTDIKLSPWESWSWLWSENWKLIAINIEYDLIKKQSISVLLF